MDQVFLVVFGNQQFLDEFEDVELFIWRPKTLFFYLVQDYVYEPNFFIAYY